MEQRGFWRWTTEAHSAFTKTVDGTLKARKIGQQLHHFRRTVLPLEKKHSATMLKQTCEKALVLSPRPPYKIAKAILLKMRADASGNLNDDTCLRGYECCKKNNERKVPDGSKPIDDEQSLQQAHRRAFRRHRHQAPSRARGRRQGSDEQDAPRQRRHQEEQGHLGFSGLRASQPPRHPRSGEADCSIMKAFPSRRTARLCSNSPGYCQDSCAL